MGERLSALKAMCFGTERDRRNERRVLLWAIAWPGAWVLLKSAVEAGWITDGPVAAAAAAGCVLLGLGPLSAYRRFVAEADELRRKIELEALAVAFGVGVLGGISYEFLELTWLVGEAELAHVLVAMLVSYAVSVVVGYWRYQ